MRKLGWFSLAIVGAAAASVPLVFVGCGDDNGTPPAVDGSTEAGGGDSTAPDAPTADAPQDHTMGTDAPADHATEAEAGGGEGGGMEGGVLCALVDAGPLDDAAVAAGMSLVANTYRCWRCHQDVPLDAGGLTLGGRSTSLVDGGAIFPPNLTPDMTGLGCWTDPQIVRAMLDGIDIHDAGMCVMPKFGHIMDDAGTEPVDAATAAQIVQFLRSLTPITHQVQTTVCPTPSGGGDAGDAGAGDGGGTTGDGGDAGATNDSGGGDSAAEASGDDGGGDSGEGGD